MNYIKKPCFFSPPLINSPAIPSPHSILFLPFTYFSYAVYQPFTSRLLAVHLPFTSHPHAFVPHFPHSRLVFLLLSSYHPPKFTIYSHRSLFGSSTVFLQSCTEELLKKFRRDFVGAPCRKCAFYIANALQTREGIRP